MHHPMEALDLQYVDPFFYASSMRMLLICMNSHSVGERIIEEVADAFGDMKPVVSLLTKKLPTLYSICGFIKDEGITQGTVPLALVNSPGMHAVFVG